MSTSFLSENRQYNIIKCLTSVNDPKEEYYLFIVSLKSKKKSKKIQKISNLSSKFLIKNKDKINYDKYTSLKFEIYYMHKPENNHSINIDLENDYIIHKDDSIYLEISKNDGYLNLFYNLNI